MRALSGRWIATVLSITALVSCLRVASASAQAPAAPPDIVRMKDGGMLRGTIVELVPGQHVTLLGVDGQSRTLKMSDVAFAGPVAEDQVPTPPPAPPPIAPAPALAPLGLRLTADEPNLTYFIHAGSANGVGVGFNPVTNMAMPVATTMSVYNRLCTAPCTATIVPGSYTLGIQRPDGPVLEAPALTLRGDEELKATYVSRSSTRVALGLTGLGLIVVGAVVGLQSKRKCETVDLGGGSGMVIPYESCIDDYPYLIPGTVMFSTGLILPVIALLVHDSAVIAPTGH